MNFFHEEQSKSIPFCKCITKFTQNIQTNLKVFFSHFDF